MRHVAVMVSASVSVSGAYRGGRVQLGELREPRHCRGGVSRVRLERLALEHVEQAQQQAEAAREPERHGFQLARGSATLLRPEQAQQLQVQSAEEVVAREAGQQVHGLLAEHFQPEERVAEDEAGALALSAVPEGELLRLLEESEELAAEPAELLLDFAPVQSQVQLGESGLPVLPADTRPSRAGAAPRPASPGRPPGPAASRPLGPAA